MPCSLHAGPDGEDLISVGVQGELRSAVSGAGVEKCRGIVRPDVAAANQLVGRLVGDQRLEIAVAIVLRRGRFVMRRNAQHQ